MGLTQGGQQVSSGKEGPGGGVVKDISDARGDVVIRQVWQPGSERAPHGKGL